MTDNNTLCVRACIRHDDHSRFWRRSLAGRSRKSSRPSTLPPPWAPLPSARSTRAASGKKKSIMMHGLGSRYGSGPTL